MLVENGESLVSKKNPKWNEFIVGVKNQAPEGK